MTHQCAYELDWSSLANNISALKTAIKAVDAGGDFCFADRVWYEYFLCFDLAVSLLLLLLLFFFVVFADLPHITCLGTKPSPVWDPLLTPRNTSSRQLCLVQPVTQLNGRQCWPFRIEPRPVRLGVGVNATQPSPRTIHRPVRLAPLINVGNEWGPE